MNDTFDKGQKSTFSSLKPLQQLSTLTLRNFEKIASAQLESGKVYSDIGFRQIRKLTNIRHIKEAQEFTLGQLDPIDEVNKQWVNNWKTLIEINDEFKEEVKSLFSKEPTKPPVAKVEPEAPKAKTKQAKAKPEETKPKQAKTKTEEPTKAKQPKAKVEEPKAKQAKAKPEEPKAKQAKTKTETAKTKTEEPKGKKAAPSTKKG